MDENKMKKRRITRRGLLKAAGWTAGGLTVAAFGLVRFTPPMTTFQVPGKKTGVAWLQMKANGRCVFCSPRAEMGQNASSGLLQIVAEELNLAPSDIELKTPLTTNDIPPAIMTAGSYSIARYAEPVARAAAGMRETLRSMAAKKLGIEPAALKDGPGSFTSAQGRVISYAEIVGGHSLVLDTDDINDPPLYTFDTARTHNHVGKPVPSPELENIVTGVPIFPSDVVLENMLYGRAVWPPTRQAKLISVDDTAARQERGVTKIVVDYENNFVGVIGETPGTVDRAIAALKVTWKLPFEFTEEAMEKLLDVDAALRQGPLEHTVLDDKIDKTQTWDVDLRFDVQAQSHAMQEPRAAVVRIEKNGHPAIEVWTGSQDAFYVKNALAWETGVDKKDIVVHMMRMGGGFGGRENADVEMDAWRLARTVDRPVKVQWRRQDQFLAAQNRPGSSHRVRLKADENNKLTVWSHVLVSGYVIFARGRMPGWTGPTARALVSDLGIARGAEPPYGAAAKRVTFSDIDLPIDSGSFRSLGATPNTFAIESAIDELSRQRKVDPVDFRLQNIPAEHSRLRQCLERTRKLASTNELPRAPGYGRGYACGIYEDHSFVAASADVFVDPSTGEIRVLRMCCVQDVGLAINPDELRAQVESNLTWGLGMALMEKVELNNNTISTTNFDSYLIPRMNHVPAFEIEIVDNAKYPPAGAGETAFIVAVPAITNAIRDATGIRYTKLPIRQAKAMT